MQHKIILSQLELDRFSYQVRLGCTKEERSVPQTVECSIKFGFTDSLKGEVTDSLSDTVCYSEVSKQIKILFNSKEYLLIEKMGRDVLDLLKKENKSSLVSVFIHKLSPPIDVLNNGVKYRCGDFF